ncbi:unnamed protein product, partial [Allacma fusca]
MYVDYVDIPVTADISRVSTESSIVRFYDEAVTDANKVVNFAVATEQKTLKTSKKSAKSQK